MAKNLETFWNLVGFYVKTIFYITISVILGWVCFKLEIHIIIKTFVSFLFTYLLKIGNFTVLKIRNNCKFSKSLKNLKGKKMEEISPKFDGENIELQVMNFGIDKEDDKN